jgi:hypothetical protein
MLQDQMKRSSVPRLLIPTVHNDVEGVTRATRRTNRSKPNSLPMSISYDSLRSLKNQPVGKGNFHDFFLILQFRRYLSSETRIFSRKAWGDLRSTRSDIIDHIETIS